jgi:hypothetical protein
VEARRPSIVNSVERRLGRVASFALLLAAAYGILLIVAGFLAPAYKWETEASSGEVTQGSDTVVAVNGLGAVVVLGVPLLATVLVGCALWLHSRRGAVPSAWTLTGLLAGFNMLAMASVGLFMLPVTAALMVACGTYRRGPKQQDAAAAPTA